MSEAIDLIKNSIRDVPDFPKPGILFKDIAPMMENPAAFRACIDCFEEQWSGQGIQKIAGLESRGFPFGGALADRMGVGFVMLRKPGKLPYKTHGVEYALEYGTDRIEMHVDAVSPGEKVLLIDDLLATGGTASAALELLVERGGANVVGCAFVVELSFLDGAGKLGSVPHQALLTY
jgi:adenine phosphoribosyltransferase